jgi:short subunit dehydrogenase-like uncharacterized protein
VSASVRPCDVISTSTQLPSHQHRQIEVWPSTPPPLSIFGRQCHHVLLVLSLDSSSPCSDGSAASAVDKPQTTHHRANRGRHHQHCTTRASTMTSAAMPTTTTPSRPSQCASGGFITAVSSLLPQQTSIDVHDSQTTSQIRGHQASHHELRASGLRAHHALPEYTASTGRSGGKDISCREAVRC